MTRLERKAARAQAELDRAWARVRGQRQGLAALAEKTEGWTQQDIWLARSGLLLVLAELNMRDGLALMGGEG